MVMLLCAIVGAEGSAFPVDIEASRLVGHLKEAIKAKKPNDLKYVDADRLLLFLAKKRTAWLKDDDPAALELEEGNTHPNIQTAMIGEEMKATWTIENVLTANNMTKRKGRAPKSRQIHVLVDVPLRKEKTSSPLADVAVALFQHTFFNVPSTTGSRTQSLKKQLVEKYKCKCEATQEGDRMLLCMVMNIGLPSTVVVASHIFRREHDDIKRPFVQIEDIDDVRNGLLLFKPIKSAFDDLDIAFLADKEDQFILKLFNPDIKSDLLVGKLNQKQRGALGLESIPAGWKTNTSPVYAPYAPEFNVLTTFGELEGKPLLFPSGSTLRPFRRCVYHQAQLARTKAILQGWVSEDYNFEDFSSEGLTLDEKMKLLYTSRY